MQRVFFGLAIAIQTTVAGAAEPSPEATWAAKAALGLIVSSGNSNTQSLTARVEFSRAQGQWKQDLAADLHRAEAEDVETADRRLLSYKLSRELGARRYAWGLLRYETDPFADIAQRDIAALGFGYRLLVGPVHSINLEIGGGYRKTTLFATQETKHDTPLTIGFSYTGQLNENVRFSQTLGAEHTSDDVQYHAKSDLNLKINSRLSLSLIVSVRHNEDVAGALGKMTDTLSTVNLVYSY